MSTKSHDVANDLLEIIDDSSIDLEPGDGTPSVDKDLLMQKLVSYVVRSEQEVWNEAYQRGREKGRSETKGTAK